MVEAELRTAVEQSGLLRQGERTVLLLSGGQDSVCLLDVAVKLLGRQNVIALHLNYGLREESDSDAEHCRGICGSLGVELEMVEVSSPQQGNFQAWAREERYRAAELLADRANASTISVAHTATDRLETILYRLITSPGRRALTAMDKQVGKVVRPLLEVSRQQTQEYCVTVGLNYVTDVSNASPKYVRNRVRNELLPLLETIDPNAAANILRTVDQIESEGDYVEDTARGLLSDRQQVERKWLLTHPSVLRGIILRQLAERASGSLVPDARTRAEELIELAESSGSKRVDLTGVVAVIEYGKIRFESSSGESIQSETVALSVPGSTRFGEYQVSCAPYSGDPVSGVVDLALLKDEVVVRQWRSGDRLRPIGLGGTKSVQDLFTDHKIPRAARSNYPVVESGGEIVWIPEIATSERFGVNANTEFAVLFSATTV